MDSLTLFGHPFKTRCEAICIFLDFFTEKRGKGFSFNVLFQKWLKNNTGKTYGDAINAYYQILEEKKKGKTTIDKQFEYNTYIRDFFFG